jgi:ribonuclease E
MQEATEDLILATTDAADLAADVSRAESWAGEPFLHPGEDPEQVLTSGTARRRALDDALAEMDAGRPSRRRVGRCATA